MAKNSIMKIVAVSVVLLFLISGFSFMPHGFNNSMQNLAGGFMQTKNNFKYNDNGGIKSDTNPLAPIYEIVFTESGLPSGISWSVTLSGMKLSSNNSSAKLIFGISNGTYSYTVGLVNGYNASPSSGIIVVKGANVNQEITFEKEHMYNITFVELGLIAGSIWGIYLNGVSNYTATSEIVFSVPSGYYNFSVSDIPGYKISPNNGTVIVENENVSILVNFTLSVPTAAKTLVLNNNTLQNGDYLNENELELFLNNSHIDDMAYDPITESIYVAGGYMIQILRDNVTKILPFDSRSVVYDSFNGLIYFSNGSFYNFGNRLYAMNSNDKIIGEVNISNINILSFDPFNGYLYVISQSSIIVLDNLTEISVLNITTNSPLTFDPNNGNIYVISYANISPYSEFYSVVLNLYSPINQYEYNVTLTNFYSGGLSPISCFNPYNNELYVSLPSSESSGTYSIQILDQNLSFIGSLNSSAIFLSQDLVYNPINKAIYATSPYDSFVSAIYPNDTVTYIQVGGDPIYDLFVPLYKSVYVISLISEDIYIINETNQVARIIRFAYSPFCLTMDTLNGNVLLQSGNLNVGVSTSIGIIENNLSFTPGADLSTLNEVGSGAFDPNTNEFYIPGQLTPIFLNGIVITYGNFVYVIASNGSINNVIQVGIDPVSVVYSPATGDVYVANSGSFNISIIRNDEVIGNISLKSLKSEYPGRPLGMVYDSYNKDIYVGCAKGTVIISSNNTIKGFINGFEGSPMLYDPVNQYIYYGGALAENEYYQNVNVLDTNTNEFVGSLPIISFGMTFDSKNDLVYITSWSNFENRSDYNGGNDSIFVMNSNDSIVGQYMVGYLPMGILFDQFNNEILVTNLLSGTVSVIAPPTVTKVSYTVTFTETGLPSGTSWSVTLNGTTESSTTNTISFAEPNGTYSYTIGSVNGYTVSPSSGTITINGANVNQEITFTSTSIKTYTVTFTENGLSSGTSWYVTLNGTTKYSTTNKITFTEPNGTYSYVIGNVSGYTLSTSSGIITVNGANVNQAITFTINTKTTYTITFTESGLPAGTAWYVNLSNGQSFSSASNTVSFREPNGTYTYTIGSINGYTVSPSTGTITVNGANVNQSITFTVTTTTTYTITFTETGLPAGTSWSVTLNGVTKTSTTNTITFTEPYGSYTYTITLPSGYKTTTSTGTVSTTQSNLNVPVTISPTTTIPHSASSPNNDLLIGIIVIVIIIAVLGEVMVMRRGKNKGGKPKQ